MSRPPPPPMAADFQAPMPGTFTQPTVQRGPQGLTMAPPQMMGQHHGGGGNPQQQQMHQQHMQQMMQQGGGVPPQFMMPGQGQPGSMPMPGPPPPFQQLQQSPQFQQQQGGRGGGRGGGGRGGGGRGGGGNHHQNNNHHNGGRNNVPSNPNYNHHGGIQAPRKKIEPDQELIQQFQQRYADQEEPAEASNMELLNVEACCKVIEENDVTFVVTDTGTGKSSLVPKALTKTGARVVSSQPRRTAAINLALRVADLAKESVGQTVGYCVRGERVGDDKLPLMYMTSYTVLLHVISHPTDLKYTHFVIDEFHERQADVEVLLSLLKLAKQQGQLPIKIILMSASVELEAWKSYFDGLKVGEYNTCKPRYSVHDYYAEEVCRLVAAGVHETPKGDLVQSIALQNSLHLIERMLAFLAQNTAPEHCVLVFLPGRTNVEQMANWINKHHSSQLEPIQWYRDVELATIHAAVNRPTGSRKKVYLATDIAEVSITLPDVVFVLDSGTTKKPRINPKNRNSVAFPALELLWSSKSAVAQRRGRVGRVQQGFYFTMIKDAQLNNLTEMEPQIANSRINELSLHVLEIAANPLAVFNLGRTTPKIESVQLSMNTLLDGGCAMLSTHPQGQLEAMDNADAKPWTDLIMNHASNKALHGETFVTTVKGIITQHMPLNIECSNIVYMGLLFGLEPLMTLAGAIAACGTPFYTFGAEDSRQAKSPELRKKVSDAIRARSFGVPSDIVAALDVTIEYKRMKTEGLTPDGEEAWCKENCCSNFRMQNILTLEKQIKGQLAEQLSYRDTEDFDELRGLLAKHAAAISTMICASHLERGIFVVNDQRKQQQEKSAGPSIFLGLKAQKDEFVASCVNWAIGSVVIPLSMQLRYDRLLASFSTEIQPRQYDFLLLCFVHDLVIQPKQEAGQDYAIFGVELQGQRLMFKCGGRTAATILEFRRRISNKTRALRVLVESKISVTNTEELEKRSLELLKAGAGEGQQLHPADCEKADALSPNLLAALEFIFNPLELTKMECETYRGDDFNPNLHQMLCASVPGVQSLQVRASQQSALNQMIEENQKQQEQQMQQAAGGEIGVSAAPAGGAAEDASKKE